MTFEVTPEIRATVRERRAELAAEIASKWRDGLTDRDWLFDGYQIKGPRMIERFNRLNWSKAWVDLGPSPGGNLGPYWHVPLVDEDGEEDTVHRLYPRLVTTKWSLLVLHACFQVRSGKDVE